MTGARTDAMTIGRTGGRGSSSGNGGAGTGGSGGGNGSGSGTGSGGGGGSGKLAFNSNRYIQTYRAVMS